MVAQNMSISHRVQFGEPHVQDGVVYFLQVVDQEGNPVSLPNSKNKADLYNGYAKRKKGESVEAAAKRRLKIHLKARWSYVFDSKGQYVLAPNGQPRKRYNGSVFTHAVVHAGLTLKIVHVVPGSPQLEKDIKRQAKHDRFRKYFNGGTYGKGEQN